MQLGRRDFGETDLAVMAIVNRTPDSFYDNGSTYDEAAALDRVAQVVDEGADIVDIGGVKAGYGDDVDVTEELRRTASFVAAVRSAYPDLVISADTWRAPVARELCHAGPTCSTTRGQAPIARWRRWRPSSASGSCAATAAGSGRGPTRTGWRTTTWWPT